MVYYRLNVYGIKLKILSITLKYPASTFGTVRICKSSLSVH